MIRRGNPQRRITKNSQDDNAQQSAYTPRAVANDFQRVADRSGDLPSLAPMVNTLLFWQCGVSSRGRGKSPAAFSGTRQVAGGPTSAAPCRRYNNCAPRAGLVMRSLTTIISLATNPCTASFRRGRGGSCLEEFAGMRTAPAANLTVSRIVPRAKARG